MKQLEWNAMHPCTSVAGKIAFWSTVGGCSVKNPAVGTWLNKGISKVLCLGGVVVILGRVVFNAKVQVPLLSDLQQQVLRARVQNSPFKMCYLAERLEVQAYCCYCRVCRFSWYIASKVGCATRPPQHVSFLQTRIVGRYVDVLLTSVILCMRVHVLSFTMESIDIA